MKASDVIVGVTYRNTDDTIHREVTRIEPAGEQQRVWYTITKHFDPKWFGQKDSVMMRLFLLNMRERA